MKMRVLASCAGVACTLVAASSEGAITFGAAANGSTGDIYPGGGITNGSFSFTGGEGVLLTYAHVNDSVDTDWDGSGPWNRGRAGGAATLSVSNAPPVVKAEAYLTGHHSDIPSFGDFPISAAAFASAGALEAYQYTGNAPMTMTLTYTLEADVATSPQDVFGRTGAYAQFGVWDDQVSFFATDNGSLGESGASALSHNGVDAIGNLSISNTTTNGLVTVSKTVKFDLVPGQIFHVNARTGATAMYGTSFADAFNTFKGEFSNPDLVRSIVPAPGVGGLALIGLAAAGRRRR